MKFPEPTEQICQICGLQYTGIRTNLCENEECRKVFAMERQANAHKYGPINSIPNGALFYMDLENNKKETSPTTKEEFFAKIIELGKKLK